MKRKIKIKKELILEQGEYKIIEVTDNFGDWYYGLLYKNQLRKKSHDFESLKDIAINDKKYLMN